MGFITTEKQWSLPVQTLPYGSPDFTKYRLESQTERQSRTLQMRLGIIRTLALTLAISVFGGSLMCFGLVFVVPQEAKPILTSLSLASFIASVMYSLSYLVARKAGRTQGKTGYTQATVAVYLLLVTLLSTVSVALVLNGISSPIPASYALVPLLAGICGRAIREVIFISVGTLTLFSVIFLCEKVFLLYTLAWDVSQYPVVALVIWLNILGVIVVCIGVFVQRLNKSTSGLEAKTEELSHILLLLNENTDFGATLSHELSGATAELNATSRQHANGIQEQLAALTEVTTSLEELSETANQIAASANSAAASANEAVSTATEVKEASEFARQAALRGDQAVEEAINSVERVRNRIELLGQRLLNLTEQTRKVSAIIDIIDDIADETHLLALNASIEAAGSTMVGETTSSSNTRGDRFGVIAQEVKNLSDRSRESTEEVRQAISEMQGAVAAAVLVAEEGKKETASAVALSQIAGSVIEKLNNVIAESTGQADQILTAVQEVNIRCDEISLATSQQRSANQQILVTMRGVGDVSQESAGAVSQLAETMERIRRRTDELNQVVFNSNEVLTGLVTASAS